MDNQQPEENNIPTPPPPRVNIRTMQSDIQSIETSGGQSPQPFTHEINAAGQPQQPETKIPETPFQPGEIGAGVPGYTGPEETIFQPGAPTTPLPPKPKPVEELGATGKPAKPAKKGLKISLTIIILIIIAGVGYYYLMNKGQTPAPLITPASQPAAVTATSTLPATLPLAPAQYISLFKTPILLQEDKIISTLDLDNIKNNLTIAASTTPLSALKEVILRNENQSLLVFPQFIAVILPELKSEDVSSVFNDNFTAVVFNDKNGSWPGYIAQLKASSTLVSAQALIKQTLENSANLKNFYLKDPGAAVSAFKDKKTGAPGVNSRYLTFSQTGAALTYGWVDDKIVISSSNAGFAEILKKLQ